MAGPYYVSSVDGDDADNGSTWALAKATLDGAFAIASAGETIYVDSAHDHDYVTTKNYTAVSGSDVNPLILFSVDRTGNPEPPTDGDYLRGATERVTTASNEFNIAIGGAIFNGFDLICASDLGVARGDDYYIYNDCLLQLTDVDSNADFTFYQNDNYVEFNETQFSVNHPGQNVQLNAGGGHVTFKRCSIGGGTPTNIVSGFGSNCRDVTMLYCDWSGLASGGSLIADLPTSSGDGQGVVIRGVGNKLPASGTVNSASFAEHGSRIEFYDNAIGTSTVPGIHVEDYRGLATEDTTTYRDATYDGTNGYSVKIAATAQTKRGVLPFKFKLWERGLTAANPTLTVQFVTDGAVTFDAADLWCEFVYPTASSAGKTVVSTVDADYGLGTAATLTAGAGAGAWTGEPASSNFYQIAHTVSGGRIGPHEVWVCLAPGAAENVFVCPRVDVT